MYQKNLILLTMMQSIGWNGQNSLYEIWNAISFRRLCNVDSLPFTNILMPIVVWQDMWCVIRCWVMWLDQTMFLTFNILFFFAGQHTLKCVVTEVVMFSSVAFKTMTFHKVV